MCHTVLALQSKVDEQRAAAQTVLEGFARAARAARGAGAQRQIRL
jgi:hypothetical protein